MMMIPTENFIFLILVLLKWEDSYCGDTVLNVMIEG